MVAQTPKSKINFIRTDFINGQIESAQLAINLDLSVGTINKYRKEFRVIRQKHPGKLSNFNFRLPKVKYIRPRSSRYPELIRSLPTLMDNYGRTVQIELILLWKDYRVMFPNGYSLNQFTKYYIPWRRKTRACVYMNRRIRTIHPEDMETLIAWKNGTNKDKWKKAVVLLGSFNIRNVHEMALQIEKSVRAVMRWIEHYQEKRLEAFYINR